MTYPPGVELEELNALQDARDYLYERGNEVVLRRADEPDVTRDRYNSKKKEIYTDTTLHGYPIIYDPTKDQLEKAGIKQDVDVLVTLATLDFTNNSLSYEDIDTIRWRILLNNEEFKIREKNRLNHFSHVYLNIVLGLFRK